jgi:hypothetical protein
MMSSTDIGIMAWFDVTVPYAQVVSEFYSSFVGWQ